MKIAVNGKAVNIPDKEIAIAMKNLGISQKEAIQMYLEDEGICENAEQVALTQKAIKSGVQKQMTKVTSNKKSNAKRERKTDPTKEEIIKNLAEFVAGFSENVQIENVGKIVTFTIGNEHFTLNLIRNRQKKNKDD